MPHTVEVLLVLLAAVLFGLAAAGINARRINFVALGLCALTVGAFLIPMW